MNPGDKFGRYQIERQLGRGGMGVVQLALDTQLQRQVALKVISHSLTDDAATLARFHREAETLARLDSPHVVTIFDHGDVNGVPYLAMQYVPGGDLGTQLKQRGPLPLPLAAGLCAQVAEALGDAHRAGVVHRDVKPTNVLVRDPEAAEPFVYLGDFGIAMVESTEGLTQAGGVAGSWAYLAPERANGAPATTASDIYALGCLFHACLTGHAPYSGSDVEIALAHVNQPVPQFPGTDAATIGANRVLMRSMAKDPAERYPTAGDLRADLLALARAKHDSNSGSAGTPGSGMPGSGLPGSGMPGSAMPGPGLPGSGTPGAAAAPTGGGAVAPKSRKRGLLIGGVVGLVVVLIAAFFGLRAVIGNDDGPGGDNDPVAGTDTGSDAGSDSGIAAISDPVAGDLNGDGLGDTWITRTVFRDGFKPQQGLMLPSDGSAFSAPAENVGALAQPKSGDVNGDGRPDLVQVVESDDDTQIAVSVFSNTGDGVEESSKQTIDWVVDFGFYGVGDFDGDGRDDLLLTRNRGESFMVVSVALSNGEGFEEPVEFAARWGRENDDDLFAIGDFDGDGRDDLVARVPNGGDGIGVRIRALLSDGKQFRKTPTYRLDDARYGVADYTAADVDGDGTDELVHLITDRFGTDQYGATLAVQRFVNGSFGTPVEMVEPTVGYDEIPYLEVQGSDVDGDGDEDLLWLHGTDEETETSTVDVYISDGETIAEPAQWGEVPCSSAGCDSETMALVGSE